MSVKKIDKISFIPMDLPITVREFRALLSGLAVDTVLQFDAVSNGVTCTVTEYRDETSDEKKARHDRYARLAGEKKAKRARDIERLKTKLALLESLNDD